MSDDDLIKAINAKLAQSNFAWVKPEELFIKIMTDPSSGAALKRPIGVAISREEALPIKAIGGAVEADDIGSASGTVGKLSGTASITLKASGTVTFGSTVTPAKTDAHRIEARGIESGEAFGKPTITVPERPIAMPPGYVMSRIARGVFFFAPKTFARVSEEIIADYRHEMTEAEAKGEPIERLRVLRAQHWGGFIIVLLEELATGIVGKIVKVLKGG